MPTFRRYFPNLNCEPNYCQKHRHKNTYSLSIQYGIQQSALPTVVSAEEIDDNPLIGKLLIGYTHGLLVEERAKLLICFTQLRQPTISFLQGSMYM